jgi:plastocyanin
MFMSRHKVAPATKLGLFLAAVLGCGGGDSNGGTPPPTTAIAKASANSGDAQSGRVGEPLPSPLLVVVTEDGSPLSGATVAWSTAAAGGSLNPTSSVTGADGVASTMWSLGTVAGPQSAAATLSGASGSPLSFTATATAGVPAVLAEHDGNNQSGEVNTQLAEPVQARVTDDFGNAVGGVPVNWAATGATLSAPTHPSDANGVSGVAVTLGSTAGPITITAAVDGLDGSPVTFAATATDPVPVPTSAAVSVRDNNFLSVRNGTTNPAVDTIAVGGSVTWTWAPSTGASHNITPTVSPTFTGRGTVTPPPTPEPHTATFAAPGTYIYFCTVHGQANSGMRGRIVVR